MGFDLVFYLILKITLGWKLIVRRSSLCRMELTRIIVPHFLHGFGLSVIICWIFFWMLFNSLCFLRFLDWWKLLFTLLIFLVKLFHQVFFITFQLFLDSINLLALVDLFNGLISRSVRFKIRSIHLLEFSGKILIW